MGKDRRGVDRGKCTKCKECYEFEPSPKSARCDYCDCAPAQHIQRPSQTSEGQDESHGRDITSARSDEYHDRQQLPTSPQFYEQPSYGAHYLHPGHHHFQANIAHSRSYEHLDRPEYSPQQYQGYGHSRNAWLQSPHLYMSHARSEEFLDRTHGIPSRQQWFGSPEGPQASSPRYDQDTYVGPTSQSYMYGGSPQEIKHDSDPATYGDNHTAQVKSSENQGNEGIRGESAENVEAEIVSLRQKNKEMMKQLELRKLQQENSRLRQELDSFMPGSSTMPRQRASMPDSTFPVARNQKSEIAYPLPGRFNPYQQQMKTGGTVPMEKNQLTEDLHAPPTELNPVDQDTDTSGTQHDDSSLGSSSLFSPGKLPPPEDECSDGDITNLKTNISSDSHIPELHQETSEELARASEVTRDTGHTELNVEMLGKQDKCSTDEMSSTHSPPVSSKEKDPQPDTTGATGQNNEVRGQPKDIVDARVTSHEDDRSKKIPSKSKEEEAMKQPQMVLKVSNSHPRVKMHQSHTFHPTVHGKNIQMENMGMTARSNDSLNNGICFSHMPIRVDQKIHLKILESQTFQGSMRIGFTFKDPEKIDIESLPAQSYPDLAQKPGFWIKPLHDKLAKQGNVITYMVDSSGDVFYSINGEDKGLFFSGVDVSGPLWLVLDIYGSSVAVKFVDEEAVADAADKTIHEGDLVKLEVDSVETLTLLQEGHGGLGDMEKAIGDTGVAIRIDDDEDVSVLFQKHERVWYINPAALQKIGRNAPSDMIREGDLVMIGTDMERIKHLQKDHGEWVDDMKSTLGRIGRVTSITQRGTLRVKVGGKTWQYNAEAVRKMNFPTGQQGNCEKGLHFWQKGIAKVCTKCSECTSMGAGCKLTGSPLRSPSSPCGCRDKDAGCADCGLCRKCAGEGDDDDSDGDAAVRNLQRLLRGLLTDGDAESSSSDSDEEKTEHGMAVGDKVKVDTDVGTFRILQEESGLGWDDEMEKVVGMEGTVSEITAEAMIMVEFPNDASWTLVPGCLTKIKSGKKLKKSKGSWLQRGALVRIVNDEERLKKLQEDHGGYNDVMRASLGKTGYILEAKQNQVKVDVSWRSWWFNRAALSPVELAEREELEALHQLKEGDYVKVDVDAETFKTNQAGHGGFVEKMRELVEKVGILHHIDIDGDAVVYYPDGTRWCINHMSLGKVDPAECGEVDVSKVLEIGDWVKVESDRDRVRQAQERVESIRWQDGYYDAAGKVGQVKSLYPFNDVIRVTVEGSGYPLSPELLTRATPEDLKEILGSGDISSPGLNRADLVKIAVDEQRLRVLQDGHGGFVDGMDELIGLVGCVSFIDRDGDAYVRFSPRRLCFSPYALTKVMPDEDTFYVGDIVLIESDQKRFKDLQKPKEHGGYNSKMLGTCGKTGRVLGVIDPGRLRVKVQGKAWIYNPDLVTRMGNPAVGTGDWKSATICASGKHDWSTGRCLVCVTCGECTHYGNLCPAQKKPGRVPGSLCGCGNGHAGCDDCGTCKKCAGETTEQAETDDREGFLQKLLKAGDLVKKLGLRTSESEGPSVGAATLAAKKEISEVLKNMGQAIELMRKSKVLDSLEAVKSALENDFIVPYYKYAGFTHRKLMGDHLANIDGAKIFMDYLKFLSSQVSNGESGDISLPLQCLELLRDLLIHYTDKSFEFCRAVGRCGLLNMLLKDLFDSTKQAQTDTLWPMLRSHLCILYNCARVQENQDYFSSCGATDVLKPYLRNKDEQIRIIALSCLAFVVDEENLHLIRLNVDIAEMIISILKAAVDSPEHVTPLGQFQYTASELVTMLSALVRNDENKQIFVTNGVMDMLIELSKNGNDGEKECAIMCIQRLAHSDHISNILKKETKVEETLKAVKNDRKVPATIRDAAATTLQILEHGPPRLTTDPSAGQGDISPIKYSDLVINEEIGKGGFGQVSKAYHKQWMMNVAVKKIKMQSREQSLRFSKALIEEAKFMHRARNAYRFIVPLYGVCVEEQFTALVMDLMENGSVGDLLSRAKPVPWALRWRILHETILGMNFLHSMDPQIIHHDLKVQNVLVDEDFHAKIADFGLAEHKKVTGLGEDEGGGLCGTITHIPPEYFENPEKKADEKFDVFSFGITIWEVLTGQRPYEDMLMGLLIRMHVVKGHRPDMKRIPTDSDVSEELAFFVKLMQQCWQQDPKKRPQFRALAEKVQQVTQQTNMKVAEAIQVVKTALGRREETIPKSFDRRWASVRTQSSATGE